MLCAEIDSEINIKPSDELVSEIIGYQFKDPNLLRLALSHRSWCAETEAGESNERLEFLGDAVLGVCVAALIYTSYPRLSEGGLAQIRSAVVNAESLATVARDYGVGGAVLLGNGEHNSGGREKTSILADTFEAILGAVYLDGGWEEAELLVSQAFQQRISEMAVEPGVEDYKTRLQELAVRQHGVTPRYEIAESGPDHEKIFKAEVVFAERTWGVGTGPTKKRAQQEAAREAWVLLDEQLAEIKTTEIRTEAHDG